MNFSRKVILHSELKSFKTVRNTRKSNICIFKILQRMRRQGDTMQLTFLKILPLCTLKAEPSNNNSWKSLGRKFSKKSTFITTRMLCSLSTSHIVECLGMESFFFRLVEYQHIFICKNMCLFPDITKFTGKIFQIHACWVTIFIVN